MSTLNLSIEKIEKLNPLEIVTDDNVRDRFIQIYDTLHGNGEAAYVRESNYFSAILRDKEALQKASKFSIFTAFIDLAICGLSLQQGTHAQCYLEGRKYVIGTNPNGNKIYENRVVLTISGYGELMLRTMNGQIKYADNPVIVYEGDEFSFSDKGGRKEVEYTCKLSHNKKHIIACYIRITRADGSVDYSVMLEDEWLRLKDYSEKNNKKWNDTVKQYEYKANPLYSSNDGQIDTGFLIAKCIKHAFKTYPKLKVGQNTELETLAPDNMDEYYDEDYQPKPQQPSFAEPNDYAEGVTINNEQKDTEDDGTF